MIFPEMFALKRFISKKQFLTVSAILFFNLSLFAQLGLQSQQVLLPKRVYIGDQAELRCTFSTKTDLSGLLEQETLSKEGFVDGLNYEDYEIKNIKLLQTGPENYLFDITFIPWKIGYIRFPHYLLNEEEKLLLKFDDVTISSLTEGGTVGLQNQLPPLLLPGTAYKLYGLLIVLVLFLIIVIRLIVKKEQVARFIANRKLIKKYKRNRKHLIKSLSKLLKNQLSDVEFAESVQQLLRNYLEVRFDQPFTRTVSSGIYSVFERATCGLLSDEKYSAMEQIQGLFIRTDFIRYGQNNSFNENATFIEGEKNKIVEIIVHCIDILEKVEKKQNIQEGDNA